MVKNKKYKKNLFFFINEINELVKFNILNLHNVAIVYDSNDYVSANFYEIKKFCKNNFINLYIMDNFKIAIKHNLSGIIISHNNKSNFYRGNIVCKKRKFKIFGKVHSQLEYFLKKKQGCEGVFLSPVFYNKKYSKNYVINPLRFSLISKFWDIEKYALGGINKDNFKKIQNNLIEGFAAKEVILNNKIENSFFLFKKKY